MKIFDMEIEEHPKWCREEKETTIIMDCENVRVHSSWRTGIKWCVQRIKEGHAELLNFHTYKGKLVSINVQCGYNLISLKSLPRGSKNKSNCFSI